MIRRDLNAFPFGELFKAFNDYKKSKFVFVEPGGNCGDYLIYKGAEKLARTCGVEFVSMSYDEYLFADLAPDLVVYVHGGGGVNRYCSGKAIDLIVNAVTHHGGPVIIGPHTCDTDLRFLEDNLVGKIKNIKSEKVLFFAREMTTYNIYKKILSPKIELLLDHDTALNLSTEDFSGADKGKSYRAFFVREDKEQAVDKKTKYFGLCIDPAIHCNSFEEWIGLHINSKHLVTNRTHSSILGAILGKDVTLMPNVYHKNRSIWEYSLKHVGVKWSENVPLRSFEKILLNSDLLQKFLCSWKVQNFIIRKIYGV